MYELSTNNVDRGRMKNMDDRTEKLAELFGLDKMMENDGDGKFLNTSEILSLKLTEYDNYRLFKICDAIRTDDMNMGFSPASLTEEEAANYYEVNTEELEKCKLWKVGEKIKHLLSLTKPSSINEINLPFDDIFIDEDFTFNNQRVFGIKISKNETNALSSLTDIFKWMATTGRNKNIKIEDLNKIYDENCVFIRYGLFDGEVFRSVFIVYDYKKMKDRTMRKKSDTKEIDKTIVNFVSNLLLFLNEPRIVTYVIDNNNNEKRIKKGKIPLPSILRTRIEIGLENYIDKIYFNGLSQSKLDYSFWVRGHWRKLISPRYKNKQGQNIWIAPYICGEGMMPPQIFEIK